MSKTVLVTGCSSGIGLCVARGLKARGHRVIASVRKAQDAERLRQDEQLDTVVLDLNDSASIASGLAQTLSLTGGRLDALVNNAGFGQYGAVEDLSRQALREQFETNLFGTHELTQNVLPLMRQQGSGRIIQNSSVLGFIALPWRGAYVASKYALEGLSDTLRLELEGSGIYVSIIEPGPIQSRFGVNAWQAFERHIDSDNSYHAKLYKQLGERLRSESDSGSLFRLAPDAVLKRVVHALESRRPRVRYPVTVPTYAFTALRRLLPYRILDRITSGRL